MARKLVKGAQSLMAAYVLVNLDINYLDINSPGVRSFATYKSCMKERENKKNKERWVCAKVEYD